MLLLTHSLFLKVIHPCSLCRHVFHNISTYTAFTEDVFSLKAFCLTCSCYQCHLFLLGHDVIKVQLSARSHLLNSYFHGWFLALRANKTLNVRDYKSAEQQKHIFRRVYLRLYSLHECDFVHLSFSVRTAEQLGREQDIQCGLRLASLPVLIWERLH